MMKRQKAPASGRQDPSLTEIFRADQVVRARQRYHVKEMLETRD
jgi:hypothetical protein